MTPMLNWSTREGLAELGIMPEEDQRRRFAYLMTPTIVQTQLIYRQRPRFTVLNIKFTLLEIRYNTYTITMHHVLSVMFLPELELSWCLLKPSVRHPGLESTMAT